MWFTVTLVRMQRVARILWWSVCYFFLWCVLKWQPMCSEKYENLNWRDEIMKVALFIIIWRRVHGPQISVPYPPDQQDNWPWCKKINTFSINCKADFHDEKWPKHFYPTQWDSSLFSLLWVSLNSNGNGCHGFQCVTKTMEFFLNGADLSLNSVISANSGNLKNHWSMNWAQFKVFVTCVSCLHSSSILVSYTRVGRFEPF